MEALLFDFGGTLDSDGLVWIDRFYSLYKDYGLDIPRERFDRAFYDSDDRLPSRFNLKGLSFQETVSLQARCVLEVLAPGRPDLCGRIVERFLADSRAAFKRNRPVLERLSKKYRLGMVSNFYGNLESVLASEGLRDLFAAVADSGVLGIEKPDPAIFQKALRDLGVKPQQAVMVGDSIPRDMRGAETLGMAHVLVGDRTRPACCAQALRASSISELENVLPSPCQSFRAGIIAAGDGRRLESSYPQTIKPLVPVQGRPLCHWIVSSLQEAGAGDFTVLFNSRGREAKESLSSSFPGLPWTFLERDTASSWESFRLVATHLAQESRGQGGDFLISTVDALIPPAEIRRFLAQSRRTAAPSALALTSFVDDEKPLWADLDATGLIRALAPEARQRRYVTCGLYYLTAEAVRKFPPAQAHGSLREFLRSLVSDGRTAGIVLSKTLDVDRPEDIRQAENFVASLR